MVDANFLASSTVMYEEGVVKEYFSQKEKPVPDHVVPIIGWGVDEDTNTKYWIVRNSYGEDFGKQGDMWVERGVNALQIEEHVIGYDVEVV